MLITQAMRLCLFLCTAAVAALAIAADADADSDATNSGWRHDSNSKHFVFTNNGPILGHAASEKTQVSEFLGLPYAQAPIGDLRFAAPKKVDGKRFLNASTWGFDCPSTPSPPSNYPGLTPQAQRVLNNFANGAGTPQNEDCLTLNVWIKGGGREHTHGQHLRPVLVHLYGGRFTIGNSHTPFYDGQYLADAEELVVVTVNYRTNIFGFPSVPGQIQNLGLRDQRLAVEWIRDNAAAFGGDPHQIILSGQSAGGVSVDYWSYAYLQDPIVKGLISHSGNALSFPLNKDGVVTSNWYNVSAQLGCGGSGDTLDCMRKQSWQAIKAAAAKLPSASGGSPLRSIPSFYPVVDNDVVFGDYQTRSDAGQFARLPYLLGNTEHEQGFYTLSAYARGINTTQAQGVDFLLSSFTCPNSYKAINRKKWNAPVWQFRYFGDWDNVELYPGSGAYHGSDLEMIFGNSAGVSGIAPSTAEQQTTSWMQHAWSVFAHDPVNGLSGLGWPQFDPEEASLNRLAYNRSPEPDFVKPSVYDATCSTVGLAGVATGS